MTSEQAPWYARTTSRYSSGSSCEERAVESTRSQNSTVSWRRSASRGVGGPSSADWTARGMVVGERSVPPIHTSTSPSSSTASRWPFMSSVFKSSRYSSSRSNWRLSARYVKRPRRCRRAIAWSRSSSNVIAEPPPPSEASGYRAGSVGAFLTHLYRKAPAKESRKRWEHVAQSRLPLPAVQGGPLSHALEQTPTAKDPNEGVHHVSHATRREKTGQSETAPSPHSAGAR